LKAQAEDNTRIAAFEIELAQKKEDCKKLEWAKKEGAATDWEIDHATLAARTTELSLKQALFEREMARLRANELESELERFRLYTPISGQVEEVAIEVGESSQPLVPVVRVVKIDPLIIDTPVPLNEAMKLKNKQAVTIKVPSYDDVRKEKIEKGRVINISGIADAASDTLRIRIEASNPSRRPAGERIIIAF
jgi:multidrug efflux pump subunit AcrA (membrane-fusion protein)